MERRRRRRSAMEIREDAPHPVAIRHLSSEEASHRTYLLQIFDAHVLATVTSSPAAARRWVHHVRYNHSRRVRSGRLVVGMAAQYCRRATAPAAVLQLCVGHRCLVFQLPSCPDNIPEADWKGTAMEGLAHLVLAHRVVREAGGGGGVDWSDWESPVLTTAQVMYACVDAYVAFRLGLELLQDD